MDAHLHAIISIKQKLMVQCNEITWRPFGLAQADQVPKEWKSFQRSIIDHVKGFQMHIVPKNQEYKKTSIKN